MDIPPPGMVRNPGLHFDRTLDPPGFGGDLLSAPYTNLRKAEGHFDINSSSLRILSSDQSLQLLLAHSVVPLENAHGLMTTGRHNPEVILPRQSGSHEI